MTSSTSTPFSLSPTTSAPRSAAAYNGLTSEGYIHGVIRHGIKEHSKGGITTNSIEGFWVHFKRVMFGTYHFVSKAYLQRYIDEAVYRYNTRKAD